MAAHNRRSNGRRRLMASLIGHLTAATASHGRLGVPSRLSALR